MTRRSWFAGHRLRPRLVLAAGAILAALAGGSAAAQQARQPFDHPQHSKLFPRCETCHVGATRAGAPIYPDAASCEACHDGTVQKVVRWAAPGPRPTNLKFEHSRHRDVAASAAARGRGDPPVCAACHQPDGSGWMQTKRTIVGQCLSCHKLGPDHVAVADTACATCHLALAAAPSLTAERIKAFPVPNSHKAPGFNTKGPTGHGALAKSVGSLPVAASCATCHARDFCISCHVNAPETAKIQALAADPRSLVHPAKLKEPDSHRAAEFDRQHGKDVGRKSERCATCHTQQSCLTCHVAPATGAVTALASAGPGRGRGAETKRTKPVTHVAAFRNQHERLAAASPRSCSTCHTRSECLECHRPDPAASRGYHPAGFLTKHPASAYSRETSCADCHNPQQFCQSCHRTAGTVAKTTLGVGIFHDGKRQFLFGHGQAARQSLESCVSCHVERDCLKCHGAVGARGFSPHGPGFDAARLKRKNPLMCIACHGTAIPE